MPYNRADESIIANVEDLRIIRTLLADKEDPSFIFQPFSFGFYRLCPGGLQIFANHGTLGF